MNSLKQYYLALIVFLIPWQAQWIIFEQKVGEGVSEYLRIGLFAVDVLMLAAVLWCRPSWPLHDDHGRWVSLILLGYLLVVSFFAGNLLVAFWKIGTVVLIVLFALIVWRNDDHRLLVSALITSAVLQSLFGLWQVLRVYVPASTFLGMSEQTALRLGASVVETTSGRWLRAYGTFSHPNILGGFLSITLLFIIDRYFAVYENFQRWWDKYGAGGKNLWSDIAVKKTALDIALVLASFVVVLAGLVATFSRSAMIALLAGFIVYWAMKYHANRIRATVLGVKLAAITFAVLFVWQMFLPELWQVRITSNSRLEQRSVSERVQGYNEAWNIFKAYPLLGTGLQNYTIALAKLNPGELSYIYQPVHNVFLLLFIELGIVGTAVVLFIFKKRLKQFFHYLFNEAPPLAIAMLTLFIVIGLLDHYLWSLHGGLLIAMTISGVVFMHKS
ncbi:hypothetical protein A3E96_02795 [Candidatus Uhrbacteria bacterium RIFCSPHIGHO2_12_FULL_46_13]|uniref:O-antigen ligase-related domain-containing protein n=1 Tax=Candidatus Uhrbacteria bacterium RIFCSPLOWO2_01_FULL_47_25 TaxID=1802402 RepID=A0A1F7UWE9_9BACT|nr:MAG: O-antigen ligase-related protein [Parcubacteria group bacterium GW2011_GWA2_46_9]OGL59997.1 MAG: hypothetical protein A2752_03575 [Candidatus Uhrbacteria bacterium RIFCSPHIGHO2_01_FULL_46_23]OGL69495.1 MAG: hypothetical protein A3D60_01545 [Candidatus Uhrbacteria bacterium RIFCSPHIGHO2_02_FULL_47_29]OGL75235.1 MAG: hypothetical protein A3E96_02795 [Candidatus Uhrbacteria bacterium RIFCSPHIGHO2_12_FULL_46_13]OGL82622.1 MAG: hypothetical protein A2936_04790 [Candidatus Uhrbacteria bacteri